MTDAETVLRRLLNKIIDEPYKNGTTSLKALTSGGANYTSVLYSVTITAKQEDNLNLFAKVANISGKLREIMNVKLMFDTELFVYCDLAQIYDKIQEKYNVAPEHRFTFPKFYGGESVEGEETVVLEDMVSNGYIPYSRFKSIDWEHAATAVEVLARMHALSFAFEKEEPEKFKNTVEKVTFQPSTTTDHNAKESWLKILQGAVHVTKDEHKAAISKFLVEDLLLEDVYKFRKPLSKIVLCHGDYRISNLLFRRQNGHLKTIVLDYQTLHTGCAPIDLLYLEFMGTDEEFRLKNHQKLIDHYFQELTLALDRFGLEVNDVYPRETFDSEYREMLPHALRAAAFVLPLVLVEAERAPELGKFETVENIVISPNQLFAERFSGLVSDCVRWGVI